MIGIKDIIIFIGSPGAGKGSLSALCVDNLGWSQLSTGNLCRKHIAEQTEIGKEIDFALKSGKLVDDALITQMVLKWFEDNVDMVSAVILDGYPRTVTQAESFFKVITEKFPQIRIHVVKLHISDDVVVDRLVNRYVCKNIECQAVYSLAANSTMKPKNDLICDFCSSELGRRSDDNEASIRERLMVYHKHENALLSFFKRIGQHVDELDVDRPLSEVYKQFISLMSKDDTDKK